MAFDLGEAMFKKQEYECARLDAFDFAWRARTVRLLAEWAAEHHPAAEIDPVPVAQLVATMNGDEIVTHLRNLSGSDLPDRAWHSARAAIASQARAELIAQRGDPTPHRLG